MLVLSRRGVHVGIVKERRTCWYCQGEAYLSSPQCALVLFLE